MFIPRFAAGLSAWGGTVSDIRWEEQRTAFASTVAFGTEKINRFSLNWLSAAEFLRRSRNCEGQAVVRIRISRSVQISKLGDRGSVHPPVRRPGLCSVTWGLSGGFDVICTNASTPSGRKATSSIHGTGRCGAIRFGSSTGRRVHRRPARCCPDAKSNAASLYPRLARYDHHARSMMGQVLALGPGSTDRQ